MLGSVQDVDIKLLRVFCKIVECGGFSPAQAALNMSASSISSHMSQLESRMGGRLCERGHGEFRLTEHGRNVLAATDQLFNNLDDFVVDVAKSQNRMVGELKLGLIDNGLSHPDRRISDTLNIFKQNAPEATVNLSVADYYGLEPKVSEGQLHIAIGLCLRRYNNLQYAPLFDEQLMLYCGARHPFFEREQKKELEIEELLQANYISWGDGLFEDEWKFNEAGYSAHIEGIAYLIESGQYIAFLPTWTA